MSIIWKSVIYILASDLKKDYRDIFKARNFVLLLEIFSLKIRIIYLFQNKSDDDLY